MARTRNLKPSFFLNEDLAELGMEAQLLFAGLWTLADRAGRLDDRPMRIKASIFPYSNLDVNEVLNKLMNSPEPFIDRYEVKEKRYIQIINFEKHQHPNVKEGESTIPAPDKHRASTVPIRPHALNPIPHTLNLKPSTEMRTELPVRAFELIWEKYPKKKGRKAAERHFKASVKTLQDWLDIQNALENYIREIRREVTDPQFVKHGSTWFFNWRDDVSYKGVEMPRAPAPPSRKPEIVPPDPTEDELHEMHDVKVNTMGRCTTKNCKYCKASAVVVASALKTAGSGKRIEKSALESADVS